LEALAAQVRATVSEGEAGGEVEAPRVEVCAADLTTPAGAEAMVGAAVERFGRLDVLYNNLGDSAFGGVPPHEVTDEAWAYLMKINLEAAFVCSRAVIPVMLSQGSGSIVHVSAAERVRLRANPGYAAAKAGLVEFCRRLARAYRDDGIRVNCICPGGMGNDLGAALEPPPPTPGRGAHPADVAGAAVYFAGDESAWVTGQVLEVDGGRGL
jgi:3-oxoacyl-[acyl-carrier protein] reductase